MAWEEYINFGVVTVTLLYVGLHHIFSPSSAHPKWFSLTCYVYIYMCLAYHVLNNCQYHLCKILFFFCFFFQEYSSRDNEPFSVCPSGGNPKGSMQNHITDSFPDKRVPSRTPVSSWEPSAIQMTLLRNAFALCFHMSSQNGKTPKWRIFGKNLKKLNK